MKIIHCADLHLDSRMLTNLTADQARERRAELLDTFVRMVGYAADHDVCAVLIAGDLFDSRHISAQARNTVLGTIKAHPEIMFFYLPGNHEEDALLSAVSDLPANMRTFGREWQIYRGEGVTVSGAVITDGNADELCRTLSLNPSFFNIVMMHGQISGSGSAGDRDLIALSALSGRSVDYLALGHIHSIREGELPPKGVWCYPGCLEGRGFDECGDHGFVLLDIDTEKKCCVRTFVPFARRRLFAPEIDVTGCGTTVEMTERVRRALSRPGGPAPDDMVKIVLTGQVSFDCEKHPGQIAAHFAPDYYAVSVEDNTRLAVDYRDFRYDATLKGEFVRTVEEDAELTEEEKSEIIRCGILALSGEETEI